MPLLTATEALAQFNLGKRTFDRWVGAGLLKPKEHRRHGGKGRPTALYDRTDVERVSKSTPRQLMAKTQSAPKHQLEHAKAVPSTDDASPSADPPDPVAQAKAANLSDLQPDTLTNMLDRLRQAERACGAHWSRAMIAHKANRKDYTVGELALLQRSWKEAADQVRRLEKELPRILYEKGRYVDVHEAAKIFTAAVTGMCAEQNQLGLSVAPLCVGKSALEIRVLVDDAVHRSRRQVEQAWKELTGAKTS